MCGSLRHNSLQHQLGAKLTIRDSSGNEFTGFWASHSRSETLEKWTSNGWKPGMLSNVSSFTEGRPIPTEYSVPAGKSIMIVYNPGLPGTPLNLVTRQAITPQEKAVHHRWPVFVDKK